MNMPSQISIWCVSKCGHVQQTTVQMLTAFTVSMHGSSALSPTPMTQCIPELRGCAWEAEQV